MKTLKKILVATDFSHNAKKAVSYAVDLARHYDATLVLAHVLPGPSFFVPELYLAYAMQLGDIKLSLDKYLADAKKEAESGGVRVVTTVILEGQPAPELTAYAKEQGCDLIVIGTHGRAPLPHALLGSVAERVLRTASCPVITVPERERVAPKVDAPQATPASNAPAR